MLLAVALIDHAPHRNYSKSMSSAENLNSSVTAIVHMDKEEEVLIIAPAEVFMRKERSYCDSRTEELWYSGTARWVDDAVDCYVRQPSSRLGFRSRAF